MIWSVPHGRIRNASVMAKDQLGVIIPVVVTVYADRTFSMETKSPPAAVLLKQAAGIAKGSGVPNREKVGRVSVAQLEEIAKTKAQDLNARDLDHAVRIIAGTARSMGIVVEGTEEDEGAEIVGGDAPSQL